MSTKARAITVVAASTILILGAGLYVLLRDDSVQAAAPSMAVIPQIGPFLESWSPATAIRYRRIRKHRYDEYHIVGQTTIEALKRLESHCQGMPLCRGLPEIPQLLRRVDQSLNPEAPQAARWPAQTWFMHGTVSNGPYVVVGFDEKSGSFGADVTVWHGTK